jgi:hypothetical protein
MPLLPFLILVGVVVVAIQKIAENTPITGAACVILIVLVTICLANYVVQEKRH